MSPDARTALYRFFDADNVLLYVGVAINPPSRWANHGGEKTWWHTLARATVTWYDSRADAEDAEVKAIKAEQPLHNRKHRHLGEADDGSVVMSLEEVRKVLGARLDAAREKGVHTVIAKHGADAGVLVPMDWYRQAREALEDPTDL